jgi:hypothetical protein
MAVAAALEAFFFPNLLLIRKPGRRRRGGVCPQGGDLAASHPDWIKQRIDCRFWVMDVKLIQ